MQTFSVTIFRSNMPPEIKSVCIEFEQRFKFFSSMAEQSKEKDVLGIEIVEFYYFDWSSYFETDRPFDSTETFFYFKGVLVNKKIFERKIK